MSAMWVQIGVEEVPVVGDGDQHALVARAGSAPASGWSRCRGCWWARRAGAPAACRRAPAPAARAACRPPASSRIGCSWLAVGDAQAVEQRRRRRTRPSSRPPRAMTPSSSPSRMPVVVGDVRLARSALLLVHGAPRAGASPMMTTSSTRTAS